MLVAINILLSSCSSTTMLITEPPGAKVYINGEKMGITPYAMTDTKIVGSCSYVVFQKEGYEDLSLNICRDEQVDVGAIIGGVFFLFPFLWTMKYNPVHTYELTPAQ